MKFNHITGNSFYLDGDSAVGVYVFDDRSCLLIDSGPGDSRAQKILNLLQSEGLTVHTVLNTHAHADHCGGNAYIQSASNCNIMASALSATVIQNPIIGPGMLYSAQPLRVLTSRAMMVKPSQVTQIVQPGIVYIKDKEFVILDLPGHSLGQIGVINPDGVAFLGDSLMHDDMLNTYPFLYMFDIQSQLETLAFLAGNNWPYVFLTHGAIIDDLSACVARNQERIQQIITLIMTILKQNCSREQIVAEMLKQYGMNANSGQYYLISSTVAAFLSYLCQQKEVRNKVEEGVMKFLQINSN